MEKRFYYLAKDWTNAHFWLNDEDGGMTPQVEAELLEAYKPFKHSGTKIWEQKKCAEPVHITALSPDDSDFRVELENDGGKWYLLKPGGKTSYSTIIGVINDLSTMGILVSSSSFKDDIQQALKNN